MPPENNSTVESVALILAEPPVCTWNVSLAENPNLVSVSPVCVIQSSIVPTDILPLKLVAFIVPVTSNSYCGFAVSYTHLRAHET